eukprot:1157757-Pelagomonas_calceolata.AAC.14
MDQLHQPMNAIQSLAGRRLLRELNTEEPQDSRYSAHVRERCACLMKVINVTGLMMARAQRSIRLLSKSGGSAKSFKPSCKDIH